MKQVPLGGVRALVTDSHGQVYVALYNADQVAVYQPGLAAQVTTYSVPEHPVAVAVDRDGTVYIASQVHVYVFELGSSSYTQVIPQAGELLFSGITLDSNSVLYAGVYGGIANDVAQWNGSVWTYLPALGGAGPPAVGFDGRGCLVVDAVRALNAWHLGGARQRCYSFTAPVGSSLWSGSLGTDNRYYVPASGKPGVYVFTSNGAAAPAFLTNAQLTSPWAAAEGLR